ncbi:MAG: FadR/GntR family transcriptional regulator [Anaerolineales bacterium]
MKRDSDSLSRQLEELIERQLVTGELALNDRLPSERSYADEHGVSRAVVRDALRSLAVRGLIEIRQGVGAVVTNDSRSSLESSLATSIRVNNYTIGELLIARGVLEVESAALAATRRVEGDLISLWRAYQEMVDFGTNGERQLAMEAHHRFHAAIITATHNRVLLDFILPITSQAVAIVAEDMRERWLETVSLSIHYEIARFIEAQDESGTRAAMLVHSRNVTRGLAATRAQRYDDAPDVEQRAYR